MTLKKAVATAAKTVAEKSLKREVNNTSCSIIYQPKAPASLNRFKKSEIILANGSEYDWRLLK